jgi:hypothetical protein
VDLKLSVLLNMIDKATAPLRGIAGSSAATSKALRETRQRLKDLQRAQDELKGFRALKNGIQASGQAFRLAAQRVTQLRLGLAATEHPTRKATAELARAERQAAKLKAAHMENLRTLRGLRESMNAAGVPTQRLGEHERTLAADIAATTAQLDAQQRKLSALTQQQQKLAAARQGFERSSATAAHLTVGGYAARASGQHLLDAVSPTLTEAKAWTAQVAQLRAMGVGDALVSDAVRFAKAQDIMGTSATDTLQLLKESYSVLRDMHEAEAVTPYLARMKFGIETVMAQGGHGEGHGATAETMFMDLLKVAELRGAAKNPESLKRVLDFATQAYVASGGLVKSEDLLNMIKTGGIAAKQLDDSSFFFGLLHTVQEMGGHRAGTGLATAYQNWAAGRSTRQSADELYQLGLLKPDAIQLHEKTGHLKKLLPDALKEGDLYRSNPFEYLMTRVVPKLNPDGQLSDQQVVSKINALFSGRKGGDLFASLYMERANIAKHLAAAPKAYGVDALYNEARGNAAGQEAELLARKADLYRELGEQLLPLYVTGLTKLVGGLRAVNGWAQRHPVLAKGMLVVAGSAGVLLATVGSLMIGLGGLLGQFALLRYALRLSGLRLGALAGGEGGLLSHLPLLDRLFPALATGARAAMLAITGVSLPVAALIAALVVAALVVRKYWQPIAAWFAGVGEGIGRSLGATFADVGRALAPLKPAFDLIVGGLARVWHWATQLLAPFQATQAQIDGARAAGVSFGEVVGTALGGIAQAVTFALRMFVGLGEAIGTAAGWVVVQWEPVKAWFAEMWQSVENAARQTLDWISGKLEAVRALIERIRNFGQSSPVTQPGTVPLDWITGDDPEKGRKVAEAIGRTPLPGTEATGAGSSAISSVSPVGTRAPQVVMHGDQVAIHVDARGNDPVAVQRQVAQALDKHERSKRIRARSAFTDGE